MAFLFAKNKIPQKMLQNSPIMAKIQKNNCIFTLGNMRSYYCMHTKIRKTSEL